MPDQRRIGSSYKLQSIAVILCFVELRCERVSRSTWQCPDGHYVSSIYSVFVSTEAGLNRVSTRRLYDFGCEPFVFKVTERCYVNESSSLAGEDDLELLTCDGPNDYAAGVSLTTTTSEKWQLLCCNSGEVVIDIAHCESSRMLNFQRGVINYQLGQKTVSRKWQNIYDSKSGDRRWWIQSCPFTYASPSGNNLEIVNKSWARFSREFADSFLSDQFTSANSIQPTVLRNVSESHVADSNAKALKHLSHSSPTSSSHGSIDQTDPVVQITTSARFISTPAPYFSNTITTPANRGTINNSATDITPNVHHQNISTTVASLHRSTTALPKGNSTIGDKVARGQLQRFSERLTQGRSVETFSERKVQRDAIPGEELENAQAISEASGIRGHFAGQTEDKSTLLKWLEQRLGSFRSIVPQAAISGAFDRNFQTIPKLPKNSLVETVDGISDFFDEVKRTVHHMFGQTPANIVRPGLPIQSAQNLSVRDSITMALEVLGMCRRNEYNRA